jgi:CheY-like chemotaxis protein
MPKLLLADDSITIQKVVELVLSDEGFEIKSVGNGVDALNAIASFAPDVVLADIEMPKMNGYQLCEKIKSDPALSHIPVILLAGAFEPFDEELANKVGASAFLIKPFESEDLINKIKGVMAQAGEAVEVMEEAEEAVEAVEAISEPSEDLWVLEETPQAEELTEVTPLEEAFEATPIEEFSLEEGIPQAEEVSIAEEVKAPILEEAVEAAPSISSQAVVDAIRASVSEKVSDALMSLDLKEEFSAKLKDSLEKILWDIAPEAVDKAAREILQGAVASLRKDIEKVIWETVPDLAESIIKKEIEKIKAEI